ncbi:MAG: sulfite exporter TauE/SafE family protein [Gammaproteobacteria bacterium]
MPADLLLLIVFGGIAGVMAGLLGIGGGLLIVPVLAILFERQGVSRDVLLQSAIGTSLATIVFTSLSSTLAHHRRNAVQWDLFRRFVPGVLIGGLVGAAVADSLPGRVLHYVVAVAILSVAVQFGFMPRAAPAQRPLPGRAALVSASGVIGALSTLVGIGGGSLTVPYLTWCSVPVKQAIATAAAIGFPIAVAGTVGYVVGGLNETGLPPYSVGYVVLPAFIGIVIASVLAAPLGAWLAHRLSETTLRRLFALFLAVLGMRMLFG